MKRFPFFLSTLTAAALTACEKREIGADTAAPPEAPHEENIVTLHAKNLNHISLQTETASEAVLPVTIKAVGRLTEDLNRTARIASTLEGRLTKLTVDLNDHVKMGDLLALVQAPELLGRNLEIKASIDGTITKRSGLIGELIEKGQTIYTISDPGKLWVIAEIKERDLAALKIGQEALSRVMAYPGKDFRGKVTRLSHELESDRHTLEARVEVDNPEGLLRPGMSAEVEIVTGSADPVVVVPESALQRDGDGDVVFVSLGKNRFEKRAVSTGLKKQGQAQILAGLKKGEAVVTNGGFILKSEMLKGELGEE